jgi:SPX domain protein involved in polyphosphate accumulation
MFFPPFNEEVARYERKFMVDAMTDHALEQQIRLHPAAFSPIFHPRNVNNIYLDTTEFDFYYDNISGKSSRRKARIRWYGEVQGIISKPVLEFKIREGMLGNKISFSLQPFRVDENLNQEQLFEVFRNSDLPLWALENLLHFKPALLNRYRRKYFLSFDQKFRLTIDNELNYFGIGGNNNNFLESYSCENVIVELKYERKYDDIAPLVTNKLPFRLTKSSKYVNGIEFLHPTLA